MAAIAAVRPIPHPIILMLIAVVAASAEPIAALLVYEVSPSGSKAKILDVERKIETSMQYIFFINFTILLGDIDIQ